MRAQPALASAAARFARLGSALDAAGVVAGTPGRAGRRPSRRAGAAADDQYQLQPLPDRAHLLERAKPALHVAFELAQPLHAGLARAAGQQMALQHGTPAATQAPVQKRLEIERSRSPHSMPTSRKADRPVPLAASCTDTGLRLSADLISTFLQPELGATVVRGSDLRPLQRPGRSHKRRFPVAKPVRLEHDIRGRSPHAAAAGMPEARRQKQGGLMGAKATARNVALVGASGAGKTTLLESLLFVAGAIGRKGSVATAPRSATAVPRRAPDK